MAVIPTEPIGSIPRPEYLVKGMADHQKGDLSQEKLEELFDRAVMETIREFEKTGSPIITDGEQAKSSFATYPIEGHPNLDPEGIEIPFEDGHVRQLPKLTKGPFEYQVFASQYLQRAKRYSSRPVKQAVIAPSALSLLYPQEEKVKDYPREQFIEDLLNETETDIRRCLDSGAHMVQIDFTEARLSLKLDPSGGLLRDFVELNNRVINRFSDEERQRIGVHTCPGGDQDATHSMEIPYTELLPELLKLDATSIYMEYAAEENKLEVLETLQEHLNPDQRVFLGVIDVIDPAVESPEEVRDLILEAADYIPVDQLGTTDDCGFSPFSDDRSTARETAFDKIRARVQGSQMAGKELGDPQEG